MNNKVWALAVLLLAAGIQARPQGDDSGEEVAVEEVEATAENDIEIAQEDAAEIPVAEGTRDFAEGEEEEAQEEVETIKEENRNKCEKCLLPIFRSKHDNFCIKCVEEGIIDPSEQQQIATALKCKKCNTKPKFRARHEDFCDNHCIVKKPSTTTTTEEPVNEDEEAYEYEENYEYEEEEEPEEEIVVKKKHKHKKHKDKKKHKPAMDMEDESYETKFASSIDEEEDQAEEDVAGPTDLEQLGPLGAILKALIVQNTWGIPELK